MRYRPRIARESNAYGQMSTDEAYGRLSNQQNKQYANNEYYDEYSIDKFYIDDEVESAKDTYNEENIEEQSKGIRTNFDGDKFYVYNNDELIDTYDARSGYDEYQTKEATDLSERGPIPEGKYMLKFDDLEDYDKEKAKYTKWMQNPKSWGAERIAITPDESNEMYGRGGFFVHGGERLKSAGCIDLAGQMPRFGGILKRYRKDVPLIVKYHKNFGKNK